MKKKKTRGGAAQNALLFFFFFFLPLLPHPGWNASTLDGVCVVFVVVRTSFCHAKQKEPAAAA